MSKMETKVMTQNPYHTLGLDPSATAAEIRRAYKRLASKLHPDKPTGDTEKFQAVQAAYDVLSDPALRKQYDTDGTIEKRDPQRVAVSSVVDMVSQKLDQDGEFDTRNLFRAIENDIKQSMYNGEKTIKKLGRHLEKLEGFNKRMLKQRG
jgi:DnaJ-class molecular chaperone